MKHSLFYIVAISLAAAALIFPLMTTSARRVSHGHREHAAWSRRSSSSSMGRLTPTSNGVERWKMKQNGEHPLQIAGSRLPDCSHACGSCKPCRLKIVSSLCASHAQSEACPISYKCMCNNKYYPVP